MKRPQFTIRRLMGAPLLVIVCVVSSPYVVEALMPPDFLEQWDRNIAIAKQDRDKRVRRLRTGVDTLEDAMYALDEVTGIDGHSHSIDEVEIIKEVGWHAHAVSKYENWLAEKRRLEAPDHEQ